MYKNYRKFAEYMYNYNVLVFLDNERCDQSNIAGYIDWFHSSDVGIDFITIDDPALDTIDLNRYFRFYIVPQQRRYRSALRRKFLERTGIDIHIQLYTSLVDIYKRNSMLRRSFDTSKADYGSAYYGYELMKHTEELHGRLSFFV